MARAEALAAELGFTRACLPETGRLLWHEHRDVAATELFVTPAMTAIVAVRVR